MRINNNLMAMNAHRYLSNAGVRQSKSLEKISSGLRINSAADDAAGLAISEKMRAQISGLEQAETNAQNGISLIQTAEGALNETHSILQRMRQLAVDSSNDTNTDDDRAEIQKEVNELTRELTRISNDTQFNTKELLDGDFSAKFHIGANAGQDMELSIGDMSAEALGVTGSGEATASTSETIEATVSGTGPVETADVTGDAGVGAIVDGNEITVSISEQAGAAATSAEITGTTITDTTDTITSADTTLTLSIDGTEFTTGSLAADASLTDVVTAINAAANTALSTTGETYASADGDSLKIVSLTEGTSSSVNIVSATNTGLADLGLTAGEVTGTDAGDASYTVTFTDTEGSAQSEVTGLAADAASATGDGDFAGVTVNFDSAVNLADGQANTLTIAVTTGSEGGGQTGDAVGIDVSSQEAGSAAITVIDNAINTVSAERSKLGAYQNRLEHTIYNLSTTNENLQASESRIRDVDVAKEMMEFVKLNILSQASQSMLAQANQAPQGVLQLLG
jgi:flagellin